MKNFVIFILILFLVVAGGILVVQQRGQTRLRQENESLRQQLEPFARLQADAEQLSNRLAQTTAAADTQTAELLKLRTEAATLQKPADQTAVLQGQNQQLSAAVINSPNAPTPEAPAATTVNSVNLGPVLLVNNIPNQFELGGGKTCTLVPMLDKDGFYEIKATFTGKPADGSPEIFHAEITSTPGHIVKLEGGGSRISFTPTVQSDYLQSNP